MGRSFQSRSPVVEVKPSLAYYLVWAFCLTACQNFVYSGIAAQLEVCRAGQAPSLNGQVCRLPRGNTHTYTAFRIDWRLDNIEQSHWNTMCSLERERLNSGVVFIAQVIETIDSGACEHQSSA